MPKLQLIGRPLHHTAAQNRQVRALPDDLLEEASRRLGMAALLGATLWVLALALDHLRGLTHGDPGWLRPQPMDVIAAASVAVSLALFFYTRSNDRDSRFIAVLGLLYMMLMALAIGISRHWGSGPVITWVGALLLIFPVIVPITPAKTLAAGLIAVSLNPIGMLIFGGGTWTFGATINVLLTHYPDYLMVGVAAFISHVVTEFGQHVARAREMGAYQRGELLGRGGMGEVYRARHRMLARPAAIKLIRPELLAAAKGAAAQLTVKRFEQEARVAASLRSPHTVALYDFGVLEDETLYFVMELLEGMTLDALVGRHGPIPACRVIYLLRQVCESLEEAHVRGLVHRDIKPANIHVGHLGLQHDFVKVLDFGLVKSAQGTPGGDSLATAEGLTPGTPAYMAPEMALGDPVDGRADLYALGCVAYNMLTGTHVFAAENALQMIAKHIREPPVPPSARAELPMPPALERLVLACLAKQPDERPHSAAELARALEAIATEPWGETQAADWWRAHADDGPDK